MEQIDPILENARAKHAAAMAEVNRWAQFISMYNELRNVGVERPRYSQSSVAVTTAIRAAPRTEREPAQHGALYETEAAAIKAIQAAGRALSTRELLDELARYGIEVGGQDPASTLSARLSRAPSLKNVRPHGWMLRDEISKEIGTTEPPQQEQSVIPLEKPLELASSQREVVHDNTDLV